MASLTVTAAVGGSATFTQLVAAAQNSTGSYWINTNYEGRRYRTERVKAPAQNGNKIKRHGFHMRSGSFNILYVSASSSACRAAWSGDDAAIKNKDCAISFPDGESFTHCEITRSEKVKGPIKCESGNYRMFVTFYFEEVRT